MCENCYSVAPTVRFEWTLERTGPVSKYEKPMMVSEI
jgi:hypothetical protein